MDGRLFLWLSFAVSQSATTAVNNINGLSGVELAAMKSDGSKVIQGLGQPSALLGYLISIGLLVVSLVYAQHVGGLAGEAAHKIVSGAKGVAGWGGRRADDAASKLLGRTAKLASKVTGWAGKTDPSKKPNFVQKGLQRNPAV